MVPLLERAERLSFAVYAVSNHLLHIMLLVRVFATCMILGAWLNFKLPELRTSSWPVPMLVTCVGAVLVYNYARDTLFILVVGSVLTLGSSALLDHKTPQADLVVICNWIGAGCGGAPPPGAPLHSA